MINNEIKLRFLFVAGKHLRLSSAESANKINFDVDSVLNYLKRQRDWLLVLDGANDRDVIEMLAQHGDTRYSESVEDLVEYLPKRGEFSGHIIITSRESHLPELNIPHKHVCKLPLFSSEEQKEFLLSRTENEDFAEEVCMGFETPLEESEMDALRNVASISGGLPLLLEQMTAYMSENKMNFMEYLKQIKGDDIPLAKPQSIDRSKSVDQTYEASFVFIERQDPATMAILYLCAF